MIEVEHPLFTSLLTHRLVLLCIDAHCFIFRNLPGDVLAAPASALGLDRCNTSLSLSLPLALVSTRSTAAHTNTHTLLQRHTPTHTRTATVYPRMDSRTGQKARPGQARRRTCTGTHTCSCTHPHDSRGPTHAQQTGQRRAAHTRSGAHPRTNVQPQCTRTSLPIFQSWCRQISATEPHNVAISSLSVFITCPTNQCCYLRRCR